MIPIPACRVVTAPGDGRVSRVAEPQTRVRTGEVVGVVDTAVGQRMLLAPGPGVVGGPLVRGMQHVAAGDGVLWMAHQ